MPRAFYITEVSRSYIIVASESPLNHLFRLINIASLQRNFVAVKQCPDVVSNTSIKGILIPENPSAPSYRQRISSFVGCQSLANFEQCSGTFIVITNP